MSMGHWFIGFGLIFIGLNIMLTGWILALAIRSKK